MPRGAAAAAIFEELTLESAHRQDGITTRWFTDADACPLCAAGWCLQRIVVGSCGEATVVHGLPVH